MDAQLNHLLSTFRFNALLILLVGNAVANVAASDSSIKAETEQKKAPEAVYVAVEQSNLFAGPSSEFYPTGVANRGTVLEVYHRTQNGWLGVRPPQGSFSWVPASQAYLLPGGRVIEITDGNSVSWIGTELGSAKQYRWQVQLKVGEQLRVLGEATIKNDTDDQEALWYRVAPPAGEFRWIEEAAVSKTAPPLVLNSLASDSQSDLHVVSTTAEAQKNASQSKPTESPKAGDNQPVNKKAVVQAASFSGPADATPTAPAKRKSNRLPANSKRNGENVSRAAESQWDGWYAFEMSEQGVRTPFLDKLSGRDRGQSSHSPNPPTAQRDPLMQDPFSLAMAGEQQKPLPSELNSLAKKQRDWRDPRSLREARLAGSPIGSLGSIAARRADSPPTNTRSVLTAGAGDLQIVGASGAVSTAGYDRIEMQPMETAQGDATANVNWYGLAEGVSSAVNTAKPGSALNVVTSTADVGELQLALNNTVASSNGPWNLAPLAERAKYLIEHGPTALDRGQARLLLERIDAFQNVSVRTQQFSGTAPSQSSPVQSTSYSAATQNRTQPNSPQSAAATYEATGWLVPVHAAGPDQPTHALTNDTGDVVAYVSPIAGLNLDRYRNQAVGINGLRGYLPQLQAAHIQAQRVSRIR
jgi:hypothetical protein